MRIEETTEIMRESRFNRQPVQHPSDGMLTRAWRMVSNLPGRLTGLFHRNH